MLLLVPTLVVLGVVAGCSSPDMASERRTPEATGGEQGSGQPDEGWVRLPDPPLSSRAHSVVVEVDGRMLVVGGWELLCPPGADCVPPEERFRDGALYDPANSAWTPTTPAPHGLASTSAVAAAVGGSAFVLASCMDGPECLDPAAPARLLEYDAAADRWTDHGELPGPEGNRRLLVVGPALLAYSVSDEGGAVPDLLRDPATGTWERLPDGPLPPVYDRSVVVSGDHLVVAGSPVDQAPEDEPIKVAARFDLRTRSWSRLPDTGQGYQLFPSDRGPVLNGHFIEASGWLLEPETWTWSRLPDLPADDPDLRGVLDHDIATYDIPNSVGQMSVQHDLRVLDSATGDYVVIPPMSGRADVHDDSSTALGRDLFVYGGQRWVDGDDEGELVGDAWLWVAPEPGVGGGS